MGLEANQLVWGLVGVIIALTGGFAILIAWLAVRVFDRMNMINDRCHAVELLAGILQERLNGLKPK